VRSIEIGAVADLWTQIGPRRAATGLGIVKRPAAEAAARLVAIQAAQVVPAHAAVVHEERRACEAHVAAGEGGRSYDPRKRYEIKSGH